MPDRRVHVAAGCLLAPTHTVCIPKRLGGPADSARLSSTMMHALRDQPVLAAAGAGSRAVRLGTVARSARWRTSRRTASATRRTFRTALGIMQRCVGKDQLAARQAVQHRAQSGLAQHHASELGELVRIHREVVAGRCRDDASARAASRHNAASSARADGLPPRGVSRRCCSR